MKPNVYLYHESAQGFELYLGGVTTLEGLSLFDSMIGFTLNSFGATSYKRYGWATENELPDFSNVEDIVSFLKSEGDIGIVEFKADIENIGTFGSHDDSECHFIFGSKPCCLQILQTIIPSKLRDLLINKLVSNPGLYLTCDFNNVVMKYHSFEEYLTKSNRF